MGGYAFWVWSSFGFALASMLALLMQSLIAAGRRQSELEALRRQVRRGGAGPDPADPEALG